MQVPYLGRAPRTKETLPDFLKWCRVIRHPLVFRGLTGSQRTLGFWGVTQTIGRQDARAPAGVYVMKAIKDKNALNVIVGNFHNYETIVHALIDLG